jgi:hypothetical protein
MNSWIVLVIRTLHLHQHAAASTLVPLAVLQVLLLLSLPAGDAFCWAVPAHGSQLDDVHVAQ